MSSVIHVLLEEIITAEACSHYFLGCHYPKGNHSVMSHDPRNWTSTESRTASNKYNK